MISNKGIGRTYEIVEEGCYDINSFHPFYIEPIRNTDGIPLNFLGNVRK